MKTSYVNVDDYKPSYNGYNRGQYAYNGLGLEQFRPFIEQEANCKFPQFEVVEVDHMEIFGNLLWVKFRVDNDTFIHVKVFDPIEQIYHVPIILEIQGPEGIKLDTPLDPFVPPKNQMTQYTGAYIDALDG